MVTVQVIRADLVVASAAASAAASAVKVESVVECGVGDDNAQGSLSQLTSTKRKRHWTATADNYSNNFPRGTSQGIGMPMNHNFRQSTSDQSHRANAMIAAAEERLRANRERNCEQTAELAKIKKEIDKLELERCEKEAALKDFKKEEEQIKNELAYLNSLTEDNARKDVKIIRRSIPKSPNDAKDSTPTKNALGQKPAGIIGSEIDADKNQVDVEMADSSVDMNSKHIIRSIENTGEETKSDSDSISDEHSSSSSGDDQQPPAARAVARNPTKAGSMNASLGDDRSSSEDDGSSHNHTTKMTTKMMANNGAASPNGVEQVLSACRDVEEKEKLKKLPTLSWDEKYKILQGMCDFIYEEIRKEEKQTNTVIYNREMMTLQDFIGHPVEQCHYLLGMPFFGKKISFEAAIRLIIGEQKEEVEIVKHKANQMKNFMRNARSHSVAGRMSEKSKRLFRDLRFDVLLSR